MNQLPRVITLCSLIALVPGPARSGEVGTNGGIELRTSFRYDAQSDHLDKWKEAYESASQLIYDFTDGNFYIESVKACNNSLGGKQADVYINDGTGIARVTYTGLTRGDPIEEEELGINVPSVRIYHFFDDINTDVSSVMQEGHVPAHELGHYVFGLFDEYKGSGGTAECVVSPPDSPACIMENYSVRETTEACVFSNHDDDNTGTTANEADNTDQQEVNGEACWETISRLYGVTTPMGLPEDAPGTPPATTWDVLSGRRGVLIIDRSGSMSSEGRLESAKAGAVLAVNLMQTGDELGVVSFSSSATTDFPLTAVTSDSSVKTAATNAVNALSAGGLTSIGGGLRTGLNNLVAPDDEACVSFMILLSDGFHNTGEAPSAVLPDLKANNIPVFTIAVGSADTALLGDIATETGGTFLAAPDGGALGSVFATLQSEAFGDTRITSEASQVPPGEAVVSTVPVDAATSTVLFVVTWPDLDVNMEVSIVQPDGTLITQEDTPASVEFFHAAGSQGYRVPSPSAGTWQVQVRGTSISEPQDFVVQAYASSSSVTFEAVANAGSVVFPTPIVISAHADQTVPLTNLSIAGIVTHPDGRQTDIVLFDDGSPNHVDLFAGDGSYSAIFDDYTDDGVYTFELVADNRAGLAVLGTGDEPFAAPKATTEAQLFPFLRETSFSVSVSGVPDFISAAVEYGPETINLKSKGKWVTAYIELPDGYDPADIDVSTVQVTAIDGIAIVPISAEQRPTELGDFDNDDIPDLMVKFSRSALQDVLIEGMREIVLEGQVNSELFIGSRSVAVIMPGKGRRN